jgi:diaminopimelate epimerase
MNGAGNDFVMLDNRDGQLALSGEQIAHLCDRNRGVGADGLLAVENAQSESDYRMRYYNADGGEAEMCGNGARCFARFVDKVAERDGQPVKFETIAGIVGGEFEGDEVKITLSEPFDLQMGNTLLIDGTEKTVHSVNTGVPHAVMVLDDIEDIDIRTAGAALRYHDHFSPAGTNANFQLVLGSDTIAIRTYERGVEDETLACGTGMVANAIVHNQLTGAEPPIHVQVRGGESLRVGWQRDGDAYRNVTLTGPADFVFEGTIHV